MKDPRDRELLELLRRKGLDDVPYETLAAELGITPNALHQRIWRFTQKYFPARHRHLERRRLGILVTVIVSVVVVTAIAVAVLLRRPAPPPDVTPGPTPVLTAPAPAPFEPALSGSTSPPAPPAEPDKPGGRAR